MATPFAKPPATKRAKLSIPKGCAADGYQSRTANDGKHVDSLAGRAPGKLLGLVNERVA
jgi:hypothetical protein